MKPARRLAQRDAEAAAWLDAHPEFAEPSPAPPRKEARTKRAAGDLYPRAPAARRLPGLVGPVDVDAYFAAIAPFVERHMKGRAC